MAGQYQFVQREEGHGVVPLQEACHKDDALYQAIQKHFEQEAKEQRPDPLGGERGAFSSGDRFV